VPLADGQWHFARGTASATRAPAEGGRLPPMDVLPVLLGAADAVRARGFHRDIVGLSNLVALPFFPQSLGGLTLVLAVPTTVVPGGSPLRIELLTPSSDEPIGWIDLGFTSQRPESRVPPPLVDKGGNEEESGTCEPEPQEILFREGDSHVLIVSPLTTTIIVEPCRVRLAVVKDGVKTTFGSLDFVYIAPDPLSDAEVREILSDPSRASEFMLMLGCKVCGYKQHAYVSVSPVPPSKIPPNSLPVNSLPETWQCTCGTTRIPTRFLKGGLHEGLRHKRGGLFRKRRMDVVKHFRRTAATDVLSEYSRLIRQDIGEEEVQVFVDRYKSLFWSYLSPLLILPKPNVLTKKRADFAVLSSSGVLYFIEFEKPQTKLFRGDGGRHSDVQKGLKQIADWRQKVTDHKHTLLTELELPEEKVHEIRYILVAGRTESATPAQLAVIRQDLNKDTSFLTFDDLGAHASAAVSSTL
jgi:hypothetical protein